MRERRQLAMMRQLLALQRARRDGADFALADARNANGRASDAERAACRARDESHADWTRCIGEGGFSPEHSRLLSDQLVQRDEEADQAGARADLAARLVRCCEQEWRELEAQVRAQCAAQNRLQRRISRRREENALAALADRITGDWRPV